MTRHDRLDRRERILLMVGCGVMLVWAVAVLVQVAIPSHPVPTTVNVVTPIVATGMFGGAWLTGRAKRNGNGAPLPVKDDG